MWTFSAHFTHQTHLRGLTVQIPGPHPRLPESLQDVLQVILKYSLVENHWVPQNPEHLPGTVWLTPSYGSRVAGQSRRAHVAVAVAVEDVAQLTFESPSPSFQSSLPTPNQPPADASSPLCFHDV